MLNGLPENLSAKIVVDVNSEVEKACIEGLRLQKPIGLQDVFVAEKSEVVNGKRTFEVLIGSIGIGI